MKRSKKIITILLLLNYLILTGFIKNPPYYAENKQTAQSLSISFIDFITFSKSLDSSTNAEAVYGLFVPGKFSFEVEQQPAGHPEFVSNHPDHLTQFSMVNAKDSFALLAHNHLAGSEFSKIVLNDYLITIDLTGTRIYQVIAIEQYQALSPSSPYSNFLSLDDSSTNLTATQLFTRIYTPENRLVLQTCLEKDGELSWGRTFIIAEELTDLNAADYFSFEQPQPAVQY